MELLRFGCLGVGRVREVLPATLVTDQAAQAQMLQMHSELELLKQAPGKACNLIFQEVHRNLKQVCVESELG